MEHTGFYFGMLKLMAYCILTSSYKIQVNLLLPTHFCAFLIVYRIMHSFIVYRLNTFVLDYSESCFWNIASVSFIKSLLSALPP